MMKTRFYLMMCCLMLALLSSCASSKKLLYFQDWADDEVLDVAIKHEAIIHCDDRLSIVVSCEKPELALPFNNQSGIVNITDDGNISAQPVAANNLAGYRVDNDGNIIFPMIGKLRVEGLKVSELKELIKAKIKEGNYISNPEVSVEFLNFKYIMIGAVGSGVYTVEGDRITLVEAIANAGDLAANARLDRVIVMREVNGKREQFVHDMRSKDIFDSPCYYLQQNDIVYVEPKHKKTLNEGRVLQYITLLTSLASTTAMILWYTTR